MFFKFLTKSISSTLLIICVLQMILFLPIEAQAQHRLIGKKAPEIVLPDRQGSLRKLSNLQDKFVLLHFWATWDNQTAATGHAEYKQLYETFKGRNFKGASGFTIYSVAFDDDRDKWLSQIRKDGVTWTNLVIEKATYDSPYFDTYDFRNMPYTFLISPRGKVMGANLPYDELYKILNKNLVRPIPPPKPKGSGDKPVDKPDTKPTNPDKDKDKDKDDVVVTPPPPPTSGKVYKVQLGVFRNPNLKKFKSLADLGTLETERVSATSSLNRVLLGQYTKTSANSVLKTVKSRGYSSAFLVVRNASSSSSDSGGDSSIDDGSMDSGSDKPTPPPTASGTVYKVQLGVFRSPNLNKFSNLRSIGTLEVESTPNGLKRVLLGSFSASEKNAVLKKVAAKGYGGAFWVKRTGKVSGGGSTTPSPTPTPTPSGNYKIQLGVFGKPNLNKFAKLNDLGTLTTERATSTLQRVMLGSYSKSKAKIVLAQVKGRGYKDAFVVKR